MNNYRLSIEFLLPKDPRTARSRCAAARRSYRSSLRSSGSTRRMASADRSGSCDGIVAKGVLRLEDAASERSTAAWPWRANGKLPPTDATHTRAPVPAPARVRNGRAATPTATVWPRASPRARLLRNNWTPSSANRRRQRGCNRARARPRYRASWAWPRAGAAGQGCLDWARVCVRRVRSAAAHRHPNNPDPEGVWPEW